MAIHTRSHPRTRSPPAEGEKSSTRGASATRGAGRSTARPAILWLGDVGEDSREEIHCVFPGGNYGWPAVEGDLCLATGQCEGKGYQEPVEIQKHPDSLALVAGVVYRGSKIPGLVGSFVYGDQVNGTHWALSADPMTGKLSSKVLNPSGPPYYVTSYGEDTDGEIFLVDYNGAVVTLVPEAAGPADTFPKTLGETGCFDKTDPKKPLSMMIPYGIVAPFWSDGASKDRFFAIPDGATIGIGPDGDLRFAER
ncbi:MAG: PQQ-dependent sugar dehydrogenase [Rubrivivax sp.]